MELDDREHVILRDLIIKRQMNSNYRETKTALDGEVTMDDLFVQISRDEYERLINLSIDGLRLKVSQRAQ